MDDLVDGTTEALEDELKNASPFLLKRVIKMDFSGFKDTDLNQIIRDLEVETLFLMGVDASCCVMHTANDAINEGYKVITSPEVIDGGRGKNIPWYEKKGIVMPVVDFMSTYKV